MTDTTYVVPNMGEMHKRILEWKHEYIELQIALHFDDVQCDVATIQTREDKANHLASLAGAAITALWDKDVQDKLKEIGHYASGIPYEPID